MRMLLLCWHSSKAKANPNEYMPSVLKTNQRLCRAISQSTKMTVPNPVYPLVMESAQEGTLVPTRNPVWDLGVSYFIALRIFRSVSLS